jgi:hypothetical protein
MQDAIENVIRAYNKDQAREAKMIVELLSALAVGAAARQRMMEDIARAAAANAGPKESQSEPASTQMQ